MNSEKSPISISFWEENTFMQPIDVAVIGAGICGLSTALFLKRNNPLWNIVVFEKGANPAGATVKNAGFSCIGSVTEIMADLSYQDRSSVYQKILSRKKGLDLLRTTLGDQEIGYEACGGFELFETEEDYQRAVDNMQGLNDWLKDINGGQPIFVETRIGNKKAILNQVEGSINSGKMMYRLLQLVQQVGVKVCFNSAVSEEVNQLWIKSEKRELLQAKKVVFCTNAYTREILTDYTDQIKPGRGLILFSKPIENLTWKGTFHMHQGYVYFRNIGDRFLIGGFRNLDRLTEETLLEEVNGSIRQALIDLTKDFLGLSESFQIEKEWVGFMGFTPTGLPLLQKRNSNQWVAAGFNGMGVALGMEFGRQAAKKITTEMN